MRKKQKNGKRLIRMIFFWILFFFYISLFPQSNLVSFFIFYIILSLSLFLTLQTFFSILRSVIWVLLLVVFLLLRQNHLNNIINTLLLLGIFITLEIYFRR